MHCPKILFGVSYRFDSASFAALLMGLIYCGPAETHDFWVQPAEYWLQPQIPSSITLQVGHGTFRQRSPIPLSRILRFEAIDPDGVGIDLRATLHVGGSADNGAQSHLPAIRFNDYLKVEGLTPALEQRERLHQTEGDGSENYSRKAKAILQIGAPDANSQIQVTRPLGLPLEIVPQANPYARPQPKVLPIRVIYEGRSLEGALVKLTHLENDAVPIETHMTDRMGRATFVMLTEGCEMLY